jgi:Helix-turn-helix domain
MDQVNPRPAYTIDGFCEAFGVGRSTAYAEIRAERLKAFKIGNKTMIAGEDALSWRNAYREAGYRKAPSPKRAA